MDESRSVLVEEDEAPGNVSTTSRLITVEPLLAFCAISSSIQSTVQSQYLYFAVGRQYNLTSVNQTKAYQCSDSYNSTKASTSEKELVDQLQDLTSMWSMYISLASGIASLIVVPFLSPMTDRLGRKWALKLVAFGDLVRLTINTAAMFVSWPLYIFVATSGMSGLTGGTALALATAFSYLADITTSKERPFRIALAEFVYGLLSMVTSVTVGIWLNYVSYQWPYVLAIGTSILNLIYIFFLLPEVRRHHMEVTNTFEIKRIVKAYTGRERNTGSMSFAILGLFIFCVQGYNSSVEEQYAMGLPFCWSSLLIGVFFGIQSFSMNVGMLFAAGIFTKCFGLHSLTLAIIGTVSSATSKVIIGFAKNSIELFASTAIGIFGLLPIPMVRSYLSLSVDKDEQGAIFASISVVQIVSSLFSSTATNTIYRETVAWFPGFVFLVLGGMAGISCLLITTSFYLYRKEERKNGELPMLNQMVVPTYNDMVTPSN